MTDQTQRLPDFLIIGAMKAGTTTLHEDLDRHPDIVTSSWKEPGYFVGPDFGGPERLPLLAARRRDYLALFSHVRADQVAGESSTHYTKMHKLPNAAPHIHATLGDKVKLIYVMRDPVARAISHYGHIFQHGECGIPTLSEALEAEPSIVDVSRYSMQLAPYRELFPAENILCLKFENMAKDRDGYVRRVVEFVGADPDKLPTLAQIEARNTADSRRSWSPWARRLRAWPVFQTHIEPRIPYSALRVLRGLVTHTPTPVELGAPREEIEARIRARLSPEDFAEWENAG
ncbi:Sulfotransferase domain-containing protein [Palleronia marisminoris]|uniref:Sulfotransferase domain protein n=1 Tax=Palleronia marisminoris TaxID=315423 RepID=A0A1Y5TXD9_9RHOB|nr:sulfotransferase [Palleronia marisminoris]SFH50089.1 Sulfotransferase domain-containing protein [Palleronia marisminoris]SLN70314.1 Sulfotransferase domain protein [Palleronia marisminoris]